MSVQITEFSSRIAGYSVISVGIAFTTGIASVKYSPSTSVSLIVPVAERVPTVVAHEEKSPSVSLTNT